MDKVKPYFKRIIPDRARLKKRSLFWLFVMITVVIFLIRYLNTVKQ